MCVSRMPYISQKRRRVSWRGSFTRQGEAVWSLLCCFQRACARKTLYSQQQKPSRWFPIVSFHVSQDVMAEAEKFDLQLETKQLAELQESRNELLSRVQSLKKDLQDWRHKLDSQVSTYRSELGELRGTLNSEVEQLRTEFQDLRATLKQQLDATASLAAADEN